MWVHKMNKALGNHSMIEDLKKSPQKLFIERVGRKSGNPEGYETPLGHTYSLILEELTKEGIKEDLWI